MSIARLESGTKIIKGKKSTMVLKYRNSAVTEHSGKRKKDKDKCAISPKTEAQIRIISRQKFKKYIRVRTKTVKDYCVNNFGVNSMSVNLTFDPELFPTKDFTDIETAHKEFKKFIQRINSHYTDFKYIAVFARQINGIIHYHMICNFKADTKLSVIRDLWRNGRVSINALDTQRYVNNYLNYMLKNMYKIIEELHGRKSYLCSRNLVKNIVQDSRDVNAKEEYDKSLAYIEKGKLKFIKTYKTIIGVYRFITHTYTGEVLTEVLFDTSLTKELKKMGYRELYYEVDVYKSNVIFNNEFPPYKTAAPIERKAVKK